MKKRSTLRKLLLAAVLLHLLFVSKVSPAAFVLGFGLILAGQSIQLASYTVLVKNTELTTQGVYRFVRHPFYVGTMFSDLGICAISGSWLLTLVYMSLFWWLYFKRILKEERFLETRFGEQYREYARHTGRLFPRLWGPRTTNGSKARIDPSLVFKNRIIPRILNLWAYVVVVVELSDVVRGGDSLLSMDHFVLLLVALALASLAAFLDVTGKRLKQEISPV